MTKVLCLAVGLLLIACAQDQPDPPGARYHRERTSKQSRSQRRRRRAFPPAPSPSVSYQLLSKEDYSHGGAQRYQYRVLYTGNQHRDSLKALVDQVLADARFDQPAHVVWVMGYDQRGLSGEKWLVHAAWFSPALDPDMKPMGVGKADLAADRVEYDFTNPLGPR